MPKTIPAWRWDPSMGRALLYTALAALVPLVIGIDSYFVSFLVSVLIYSIFAMGLQLILGYAGIISLGHAAFFGVGAYASAILTKKLGLPFSVGFLAALATAFLFGLIMTPTVRLRDINFAMATFAFGIIATQVFLHWSSLTGGHDGIPMLPAAGLGPFAFDTSGRFYYFALLLLLGQYLLFRRLLVSHLGLALNAIRQNETAAQACGVNLAVLKVKVILIGSVSAGAAGSLFAHFNGSVSPLSFSWVQSVAILAMIVVGGLQSFGGAIVGVSVLLFLTDYLRILAEYSMLSYGVILAVFMIFMPKGIVGFSRQVGEAARRRFGMVKAAPPSALLQMRPETPADG
ncbi:MAG: branched-chain amino acid ABC transporter permease [Candidatus Tectomicrobia bacterium]|nr:branched-chain amino acid ABC transporter permease [Candidatus Tectomicrobia bacterium]